MELVGELTQAEVNELNGCWSTAKTILGTRKLVLDLTRLKAVDEAGQEWLSRMTAAGALRIPDASPGGLSHQLSKPPRSEAGLFSRLLSLFRGSRTAAAGSTTQVQ